MASELSLGKWMDADVFNFKLPQRNPIRPGTSAGTLIRGNYTQPELECIEKRRIFTSNIPAEKKNCILVRGDICVWILHLFSQWPNLHFFVMYLFLSIIKTVLHIYSAIPWFKMLHGSLRNINQNQRKSVCQGITSLHVVVAILQRWKVSGGILLKLNRLRCCFLTI